MNDISGLYMSQSGSMEFSKLLDQVQAYLSENYKELMVEGGAKNPQQTKAYIRQYLSEQRLSVDGMPREQTVNRLYREMAEYSFLTPYLNFEIRDVEGIEICAWDNVWISYSNGTEKQSEEHFFSPEHARNVIIRLLHQSGISLDNTKPLAIGHLGKNIRITVDGGGGTLDDDVGVSVSIRFVNPNHLSCEDLIRNGTLTPEMMGFLVAAYQYGASMVIAGKTNSGKTTLMSDIMARAVPDDKKLITIEYEDREFDLIKRDGRGRPLNKVLHLCTRESEKPELAITAQRLVEFSMTMNPAYFCLSEIKGGEAFATMGASESGHPTITTTHASSAEDIPNRLVPLASLASNFSEKTLYFLMARAFPILVFARKNEDGKRRIAQICESVYEGGRIRVVPLWLWRTEYNEKAGGKTVVHGRFEKVHNISETLRQKLRENDIPENVLRSFLTEEGREGISA